jgi:poly-gamma-glutamate synthesis protein (capsule biosynthesis protein)
MLTLCLAGDVMTGRGIDQILPHAGSPVLFEEYVRNAQHYVAIAERAHGRIGSPVDFAYIWGCALEELERARPDARIANLETAVTTAGDPWPGKGVHYRMHPANAPCLAAGRIDCWVLANNHVLDWGYAGLAETLEVLHRQGMRTAGAGKDAREAAAPAVIETAQGVRVSVYAFCTPDSGVPLNWAAGPQRAGVDLLPDLSIERAESIGRQIERDKRPGDIVVASLHWGGNWGYEIGAQRRAFAQALIERALVDVVHGHSSHHPLGIEIHRGKLILYGCGDLLNDYEGIGGYEEFRPHLAVAYLPALDASTGQLVDLRLLPMQVDRMQLRHASGKDTRRLRAMLDREGSALGTAFSIDPDGWLRLTIPSPDPYVPPR